MRISPAGAVVVHGRVGGSRDHEDGCVGAAGCALAVPGTGGDALDAAVVAVVLLEVDGRFNAGTGAVLGLDGATVEMDASLMDSRGRLGTVGAVGEQIRRHLSAHTVKRWLEQGVPLELALQRGGDLLDKDLELGLSAVTRTEAGSFSNRDMPQARIIKQ